MRLWTRDKAFKNRLHLPWAIAYYLYDELRECMKHDGKLEFFFDQSINLVHCAHDFDIKYDDKLGCCLKRMLIVAFCEAIMEMLQKCHSS